MVKFLELRGLKGGKPQKPHKKGNKKTVVVPSAPMESDKEYVEEKKKEKEEKNNNNNNQIVANDNKKVWEKKVYKFPVIKNHRNPNYPSVTYYLQQGFSYTQEVVDMISLYHPCTLDKLKVSFRDNEHPYCAAMRTIGEAWILNQLITELSDYRGVEAMILDVGGAAARHHSNKRGYVWSCIPKFDARDFVRAFKLPGTNHCDHDWVSCGCHSFVASISIHSLYYIDESTILQQLLKQSVPVHYALVHFYDLSKGVIMAKEMEYSRDGELVWVKARGNLTNYCHRNTDWMKTGHFSDENGTLEWDIARRFGDSVVLRFVATTEIFKAPPTQVKVMEIPKMDVKVSTDDEKFEEIVRTTICYGAAMNPKNFQQYMHKVNRKGNERGLDCEALAAFAAIKYREQPVVIPEFDSAFIERCREKLSRLRFDYVVPRWNLIFAMGMLYFLANLWYFGVNSWILVWFLPVSVVFVALASFSLDSISVCKTKKAFLPLNLLHYMRKQVQVDDYCCTMPLRPVDPTKCTKLVFPPDYHEECEAKPAARPLIYLEDTIPFFPRKCSHNQVSCLNKLIRDIGDVGTYSFGIHTILRDVASKISTHLEPLTWEQWVSRFPGPKQTKLRREFEDRQTEKIVDWNRSSIFMKYEAMPEPKYPRPIVASEVEFNFQMGRWLIPLGELLASFLPSNIMFPIHGDSIAIGAFFDEYIQYVKSVGDFTQYDSSQRKEALNLLGDFYLMCGVPEVVVKRELLDIDNISIRTRKGLKAKLKAIRCSGRSATLIGNTVLTINSYLHIFGVSLKALLVKGDDAVPFTDHVPNKQEVETKFRDNGLLFKFSTVRDEEVEFCSSIFVPYLEGSVLTPKPGKILGKTFWCKHMHYSVSDMMDQMVSIAKGLECSLSTVPGICGLYKHPLFASRYDSVRAHYEEYNEYADEIFTPCDATVSFICDRYGLEPSMLDELECELQSGFPIELTCHAARVMVEKDWSPPRENEGVVISTIYDKLNFLISPIFEEGAKFLVPPMCLLFCVLEWARNGSYFNMLLHLLITLVGRFSLTLAILLHYIYNLVSSRHQINLLIIMTRRGKGSRQVSKEVVIYKAPQNNKQSKKKKKKKGKVKSRVGGMSTFALSRLNPFLNEVEGVRNPDEYSYVTATAVCRSQAVITTDASGAFAFGITPVINSWINKAASITTGTVTWSGGSFSNAMPQLTALQNLASGFRVVSYGIRVMGEVSLTAASGHFYITHCPLLFDTTWPYAGWPTTEGGFIQMPLSEKWALTEACETPIIASGRQMDNGANRFRSLTGDEKSATTVGVESMDGWAAILMYGTGLPTSANALSVEIIMHVEYVHDGSTAYGFITALPSPNDPASVQQAAIVGSGSPIGVAESLIDNVEKAADAAARVAYRAASVGYKLAGLAHGAGKLTGMLGMGRGIRNVPFLMSKPG
jgi:hypothetical protein